MNRRRLVPPHGGIAPGRGGGPQRPFAHAPEVAVPPDVDDMRHVTGPELEFPVGAEPHPGGEAADAHHQVARTGRGSPAAPAAPRGAAPPAPPIPSPATRWPSACRRRTESRAARAATAARRREPHPRAAARTAPPPAGRPRDPSPAGSPPARPASPASAARRSAPAAARRAPPPRRGHTRRRPAAGRRLRPSRHRASPPARRSLPPPRRSACPLPRRSPSLRTRPHRRPREGGDPSRRNNVIPYSVAPLHHHWPYPMLAAADNDSPQR